MKHHFTAELQRRRRGATIFISLIFVVLTVLTARFGFFVAGVPAGSREFDFGNEWGSLLFLLVPWAGAVVMAWRRLRHGREHANYAVSFAANLHAMLDENRIARARLKTVAWLHGAILVLLPLVVYQLRAAGKAGDEVLVPAFVIWPLISVAILFGMRRHHQRKLAPEKRELEILLRQYE